MRSTVVLLPFWMSRRNDRVHHYLGLARPVRSRWLAGGVDLLVLRVHVPVLVRDSVDARADLFRPQFRGGRHRVPDVRVLDVHELMRLAGLFVFQLVIESSSQAGIEPALHGVVANRPRVRRHAEHGAAATVVLPNSFIASPK